VGVIEFQWFIEKAVKWWLIEHTPSPVTPSPERRKNETDRGIERAVLTMVIYIR